MLTQLIYASRVTPGLGNADIRRILEVSQSNNRQTGITGALCFTGRVFLQCLEGHRKEVNATYHRIVQDSRHTEPTLLVFEEISRRQFTQWAMGYLGFTAANRDLFLRYSPTAELDPYGLTAASVRMLFAEAVDAARVLTGTEA